MTQDDVIRMAREAGFVEYELDDGTTNSFDKRYAKFYKLVAEHEREACAQVCEDNANDLSEGDWDCACINCADHIRERGEA